MHSLINDKSHFDRHLHKLGAKLDLWNENFFRLVVGNEKFFPSLLKLRRKKRKNDLWPKQVDVIIDKPPRQMY